MKIDVEILQGLTARVDARGTMIVVLSELGRKLQSFQVRLCSDVPAALEAHVTIEHVDAGAPLPNCHLRNVDGGECVFPVSAPEHDLLPAEVTVRLAVVQRADTPTLRGGKLYRIVVQAKLEFETVVLGQSKPIILQKRPAYLRNGERRAEPRNVLSDLLPLNADGMLYAQSSAAHSQQPLPGSQGASQSGGRACDDWVHAPPVQGQPAGWFREQQRREVKLGQRQRVDYRLTNGSKDSPVFRSLRELMEHLEHETQGALDRQLPQPGQEADVSRLVEVSALPVPDPVLQPEVAAGPLNNLDLTLEQLLELLPRSPSPSLDLAVEAELLGPPPLARCGAATLMQAAARGLGARRLAQRKVIKRRQYWREELQRLVQLPEL